MVFALILSLFLGCSGSDEGTTEAGPTTTPAPKETTTSFSSADVQRCFDILEGGGKLDDCQPDTATAVIPKDEIDARCAEIARSKKHGRLAAATRVRLSQAVAALSVTGEPVPERWSGVAGDEDLAVCVFAPSAASTPSTILCADGETEVEDPSGADATAYLVDAHRNRAVFQLADLYPNNSPLTDPDAQSQCDPTTP